MKGYLFGLGAMLVGAGLMFALMHGEVRAESSEFTWLRGGHNNNPNYSPEDSTYGNDKYLYRPRFKMHILNESWNKWSEWCFLRKDWNV